MNTYTQTVLINTTWKEQNNKYSNYFNLSVIQAPPLITITKKVFACNWRLTPMIRREHLPR